MRIYPLLMSAAAIGALTTVSNAAGSTEAPAKKQRIAITATYSPGTEMGTFTLTPLTPGPLKQDSGTFVGSGDIKPTKVRNGQSVTVIVGSDQHTGKNGTFTVFQRIELVAAGGPVGRGKLGYSVATGTWSISGGTGAYAGLAGGGGRGDVIWPGLSKVRFSEEGIVGAR